MELLFEIIFEIIIEGTLEIGTSKKAPLILRVLATIIFFTIYTIFILLFLFLALDCFTKSPIIAWLLILFDIFLIILTIYSFRKKKKEKNNTPT